MSRRDGRREVSWLPNASRRDESMTPSPAPTHESPRHRLAYVDTGAGARGRWARSRHRLTTISDAISPGAPPMSRRPEGLVLGLAVVTAPAFRYLSRGSQPGGSSASTPRPWRGRPAAFLRRLCQGNLRGAMSENGLYVVHALPMALIHKRIRGPTRKRVEGPQSDGVSWA